MLLFILLFILHTAQVAKNSNIVNEARPAESFQKIMFVFFIDVNDFLNGQEWHKTTIVGAVKF